jgi:hypothetical protein
MEKVLTQCSWRIQSLTYNYENYRDIFFLSFKYGFIWIAIFFASGGLALVGKIK